MSAATRVLRRTATSALVLLAIAAVLGLLASPSSHAAVGDLVFQGRIACTAVRRHVVSFAAATRRRRTVPGPRAE